MRMTTGGTFISGTLPNLWNPLKSFDSWYGVGHGYSVAPNCTACRSALRATRARSSYEKGTKLKPFLR